MMLEQRIATIDLGSNAVRLMIGRVDRAGRLRVLDEKREPLRLGTDAFKHGALSTETEKQLVQTLLLFKYLSWKLNVKQIRAVATSALRSARNGSSVVARVRRETGISIDIVDGIEEARLIHEAVRRGGWLHQKPSLILDLGGGSLEWILSRAQRILFATSRPMGTVRLLQTLGHKGYQAYAEHIRTQIYRTIEKNPILELVFNQGSLIGTGGNFRCLGKLCQKFGQLEHSGVIHLNELAELSPQLFSMSYQKRQRFFDLRPDRADVILPASVLTLEIMKAFNMGRMLVPDVGVKNGIFWRTLKAQA